MQTIFCHLLFNSNCFFLLRQMFSKIISRGSWMHSLKLYSFQICNSLTTVFFFTVSDHCYCFNDICCTVSRILGRIKCELVEHPFSSFLFLSQTTKSTWILLTKRHSHNLSLLTSSATL